MQRMPERITAVCLFLICLVLRGLSVFSEVLPLMIPTALPDLKHSLVSGAVQHGNHTWFFFLKQLGQTGVLKS